MNNQVKLIDQAKLLEWLEDQKENSTMLYESIILSKIERAVLDGKFDTPPVPTIKPGDKVKYTGWKFKDEVDTAIVDHLRVQALATYAVIESGKKYYIVPLNHLEVVE